LSLQTQAIFECEVVSLKERERCRHKLAVWTKSFFHIIVIVIVIVSLWHNMNKTKQKREKREKRNFQKILFFSFFDRKKKKRFLPFLLLQQAQ
jgi:hypothetical protein